MASFIPSTIGIDTGNKYKHELANMITKDQESNKNAFFSIYNASLLIFHLLRLES
ncbi:hypothetical protein V512_008515 [Mesotoga sp. Brook.08.105.5.1]|nr:hypothetical protein V512_008515 [Mesotoga sp. Brook.08.105.5.1]RAO97401.1 hypothetical protein M388_01115 [Mesotoga sp. Brook.08.YT.4.2.5.4.]